MERSARVEKLDTLYGYIHAMLRLDFDQEVPAEEIFGSSGSAGDGSSKSGCGEFRWAMEGAAPQRLRQLSSTQLALALQEAQNLLTVKHRTVQRLRSELGKPCIV